MSQMSGAVISTPQTAGNSYGDITAGGEARQHNGNVINNYANTYTLRQRRSDETLRETDRSPMLLKAAGEGQTLRVDHLIGLGVNLDFQDDSGMNALHHAVLSGFEDTVERLLKTGIDVNAESAELGTPLCLAALKARRNVMLLLIKARANLNALGGRLGNALACAVFSGDFSAVKLLIEHRVDLNRQSTISLSSLVQSSVPVFDGSLTQDQSEVIVPQSIGKSKLQPLHIATWTNKLDIVTYLLDCGANIDARCLLLLTSPTEQLVVGTSLTIAANNGNLNMLKLLLDRGADIGITGSDCRSALMITIENDRYECFEQLAKTDRDLSIQDSDGETALHKAARSSRFAYVKTLLALEVRLDIKNRKGETALHQAVKAKGPNEEVVSALLAANVDINAKDREGSTPLDVSVASGSSSIAQTLARHHARFSRSSNSYSLIRLLNADTLKFECFGIFQSGVPDPTYATLSHRWNADEVTYQDVIQASGLKGMASLQRGQKLINFCHQAKRQNIEWVWCDSCCIDKDNKSEIGEAIANIMRWHEKALLHFIYLEDVDDTDPNIGHSRIFRRSWMLQELLANKSSAVHFYDQDWRFLGTRSSLCQKLSQVMRIRPEHLDNYKIACAAAKLSWAAPLRTTKGEDRSYSMLGILGISMDLRYGEGEETAFRRLQECIINQTGDESVLAWRLDPDSPELNGVGGWKFLSGELLALSFDCFKDCGNVIAHHDMEKRISCHDFGVVIDVPDRNRKRKELDLFLRCEEKGALISIELQARGDDRSKWRRIDQTRVSYHRPNKVESTALYRGHTYQVVVPHE